MVSVQRHHGVNGVLDARMTLAKRQRSSTTGSCYRRIHPGSVRKRKFRTADTTTIITIISMSDSMVSMTSRMAESTAATARSAGTTTKNSTTKTSASGVVLFHRPGESVARMPAHTPIGVCTTTGSAANGHRDREDQRGHDDARGDAGDEDRERGERCESAGRSAIAALFVEEMDTVGGARHGRRASRAGGRGVVLHEDTLRRADSSG